MGRIGFIRGRAVYANGRICGNDVPYRGRSSENHAESNFCHHNARKDGYPYQSSEDIARLNAAVVPKLRAKGIVINDLYATVYPIKEQILREDDMIHLNDEGIKICSEQVLEAIRKMI